MSHIVTFQHAMQTANFATPRPQDLGRSVRDFYNDRGAFATPRRFSTFATPTARKVNFAPDLVAGTEEDEHKEHLEELLGQSWQVHSVGPLFGFDRSKFLALSSRLKEALPSTTTFDLDQVTVETVMGIRGSREDAQAVRITVNRISNGHDIRLFIAYFAAVDASDLDLESPYVNLPVCLSAGDVGIGEAIFATFEKLFDTIIRKVDFNADDLSWMIALWVGCPPLTTHDRTTFSDPDEAEVAAAEAERAKEKQKKSDVVKLLFEMPPNVKSQGITTVDFRLEGPKVRDLWSKIRSKNDADFSIEEKEAFHDSLRLYIKSLTEMNIQPMVLTTFSLPILSAARSGWVRVNGVKNLKSILRFLTSKCQGDLFSAKPRMALLEEAGNWDAYD